MGKKEKVVILVAEGTTQTEVKGIVKVLRKADLPFQFFVTNKPLKTIDADELRTICEMVLETLKK